MASVDTIEWAMPATQKEAMHLTRLFKREISHEHEEVPQWDPVIGSFLPLYTTINPPRYNEYGVTTQKTKTSLLLVRYINKQPAGFVRINYNVHNRLLDIDLKDVYMTPKYRGRNYRSTLANEIIELLHRIKTENKHESSTITTMLGSIKGYRLWAEIKNNLAADMETNVMIDPSTMF